MSYMILSYGSYDVPEDEYDIETEDEVMKIFHDKIERWCDDHKVYLEDTDYCEEDDVFIYGEQEEGACIIAVYRVPELENEFDEYLWEAKMEIEKACFAAEDYKWTLTESDVAYHAITAQKLIDQAKEIEGGWEYED